MSSAARMDVEEKKDVQSGGLVPARGLAVATWDRSKKRKVVEDGTGRADIANVHMQHNARMTVPQVPRFRRFKPPLRQLVDDMYYSFHHYAARNLASPVINTFPGTIVELDGAGASGLNRQAVFQFTSCDISKLYPSCLHLGTHANYLTANTGENVGVEFHVSYRDEFQFKNMTQTDAHVTFYTIVSKDQLPRLLDDGSNTLTPLNAWKHRWRESNVKSAQVTAQATALIADPTLLIGANPTASPEFNKYYKIIEKDDFIIASGAIARKFLAQSWTKFNVTDLAEQMTNTAGNVLDFPGVTRYGLVVFHGAPYYSDTGAVGPPVDVVSQAQPVSLTHANVADHYFKIPPEFTFGNTFAANGAQSMILIDTDRAAAEGPNPRDVVPTTVAYANPY